METLFGKKNILLKTLPFVFGIVVLKYIVHMLVIAFLAHAAVRSNNITR